MRRDPAITFRGALQILGVHDRPWLDRLNALLGGVVLASVGVPPVSGLFELVDQKNEATGLLRSAVGSVSQRLTRTGGLDRHELVLAAHTAIVVSALFDTIDRAYPGVDFSDTEKLGIVTGSWERSGESVVRALYGAEVPAPALSRGFHENVAAVREWAGAALVPVDAFLDGLAGDFRPLAGDSQVLALVEGTYRTSFQSLAATVPEFKVWSDLTEHAATRSALARLETLLTTPVPAATRDLRTRLAAINRAELTRRVIDVDTDGFGSDTVFPDVADIFITPRFRHTTAATRDHRIADDTWWHNEVPVSTDLDLALARHFSGGESTARPLLLLGHPGAGKSLLMKVLAARLPADTYTVVRVPLRRVEANATITEQVQAALSLISNRAIPWDDLADQSASSVRVILLDGLDELLQATTHDRSRYLAEVAEFQRTEAVLGRPVAVVVTSRTLVADRVRLPEGTPVVKLEPFDAVQIEEWVRAWNNANVREMPLAQALQHDDLAQQPLLLLMLTLYFTDPQVELAGDLTLAELYESLFATYARREVTKQAGRPLSDGEAKEAVRTQLDRLSVAAMGMFNRGTQMITEDDLAKDLAALGRTVPPGVRVLGEFFFIHAPEATVEVAQRGYEFLHATFGEYLVASFVVETLRDVADSAFGGRRERDPDDELLAALFGFQPLTIQAPVVEFLFEMLSRLPADERADISAVLDKLIATRRSVVPRPEYRPLPPNIVRFLAAHSLNLYLLRGIIGPIDLPDDGSWRAQVDLWSAGLDVEGFRSITGFLKRESHKVSTALDYWQATVRDDDINTAVLQGNIVRLNRLRAGMEVLNQRWHQHDEFVEPGEWNAVARGVLAQLALGDLWLVPPEPPSGESFASKKAIAELGALVLRVWSQNWPKNLIPKFRRWLTEVDPTWEQITPPFSSN
ncbi:NACHT domain-containing protein [Actinokineospora pegani]|uniref:NACHT domain-containing protein n=1 Tax=Actinokineospora pegani TaxID=2654637 RepID=UPI0012EB0227|nr:AAA family ATPase [Actinokineospora pegani]